MPFFGIGMKTDLFQSCGHCWVFQICWSYWVQHFTASSFRIWNSSTGIPSPPLALFVVMLPKAHLTSHSRMSGSRWVITPSVYSCYLFLISSASVRSLPFLSFIESIFAWNVPLVSLIFLKRSLVFRKPFSSHLGCFFQKVQDLFKLSILNAYFHNTVFRKSLIFRIENNLSKLCIQYSRISLLPL